MIKKFYKGDILFYKVYVKWFKKYKKSHRHKIKEEMIMENEANQIDLREKAKLIELKPVKFSTNIAGMGYSETTNLLKVAFKNKDNYTTYLYEGVEPEVYNKLCEADSIGKALSEYVIRQKEKYKYIKL